MVIHETQPVSSIQSISVAPDWSGDARIYLKEQDTAGLTKIITVNAIALANGEIAHLVHAHSPFVLMRAIALASRARYISALKAHMHDLDAIDGESAAEMMTLDVAIKQNSFKRGFMWIERAEPSTPVQWKIDPHDRDRVLSRIFISGIWEGWKIQPLFPGMSVITDCRLIQRGTGD